MGKLVVSIVEFDNHFVSLRGVVISEDDGFVVDYRLSSARTTLLSADDVSSLRFRSHSRHCTGNLVRPRASVSGTETRWRNISNQLSKPEHMPVSTTYVDRESKTTVPIRLQSPTSFTITDI